MPISSGSCDPNCFWIERRGNSIRKARSEFALIGFFYVKDTRTAAGCSEARHADERSSHRSGVT